MKFTEKNIHDTSRHNKIAVLAYRWIILICIGIIMLSGHNEGKGSYALLEAIIVTALYNLAVTIYALKKKGKINKASSVFIYIDIFLLTVISYLCGGLNSDVYLFIFFLLGYCGILNNASYTLKIGIFSAIFYTASCLFASGFNNIETILPKLVIRDLLLILGAYGMSRINYEVKKYDELRKKEFKLARTDKLTGLANRHYFDQKLHEEVEYADMNNSVLNVLILDLDNFKLFNDTYGHLSGDKLLVLFADIIKQCIRKSDIPVRYGGEEFLLLIRDLDIIIAKNVAERIRYHLEKQKIYADSGDNRKKLSVSCGIAQYPKHSQNIKQVIELADRALYHAKEIGKNIVVTYDETVKE